MCQRAEDHGRGDACDRPAEAGKAGRCRDPMLVDKGGVYRTIIETMKEGVAVVTPDGMIRYYNAQFGEIVRRPAGRLVGRMLSDLAATESRSSLEALLRTAARRPVRRRMAFQSGDGTPVPTLISMAPVRGGDEPALCLVVADLSELEHSDSVIRRLCRQDESLRKSRERYRRLIETTNEGVWEVNGDLVTTYVNPRMAQMLGYAPREMIGRKARNFMADGNGDVLHRWENPQGGGEACERRLRRKDGSTLWVLVSASPLRDRHGQECGWFAMCTNITRRKAAEAALQQTHDELEVRVAERTAELSRAVKALEEEVRQRMSVQDILRERSRQLRTMASQLTLTEQRERDRLAVVLHDGLQQLLVGARFRLETIKRSADPTTRSRADEVGELLAQSLAISRSLTAELSPPVLQQGLASGLEWLANWMRSTQELDVELDIDRPLKPLGTDTTLLLFQATRELLFNVVKHAGVRSVSLHAARSNDRVLVTVADEGRGFDPAKLDGDIAEADGFGLLHIRRRIDSIGGRMDIDSAPGRGSRFVLTAPCERSNRPPAPTAPPPTARDAGGDRASRRSPLSGDA